MISSKNSSEILIDFHKKVMQKLSNRDNNNNNKKEVIPIRLERLFHEFFFEFFLNITFIQQFYLPVKVKH